MSWYSMLGIAVAAWVTASIGVTAVIGMVAARRDRLAGPPAPVVRLTPRVAAHRTHRQAVG
jgi:hypothetical protein